MCTCWGSPFRPPASACGFKHLQDWFNHTVTAYKSKEAPHYSAQLWSHVQCQPEYIQAAKSGPSACNACMQGTHACQEIGCAPCPSRIEPNVCMQAAALLMVLGAHAVWLSAGTCALYAYILVICHAPADPEVPHAV